MTGGASLNSSTGRKRGAATGFAFSGFGAGLGFGAAWLARREPARWASRPGSGLSYQPRKTPRSRAWDAAMAPTSSPTFHLGDLGCGCGRRLDVGSPDGSVRTREARASGGALAGTLSRSRRFALAGLVHGGRGPRPARAASLDLGVVSARRSGSIRMSRARASSARISCDRSLCGPI